jgi:hypothetical protein
MGDITCRIEGSVNFNLASLDSLVHSFYALFNNVK